MDYDYSTPQDRKPGLADYVLAAGAGVLLAAALFIWWGA